MVPLHNSQERMVFIDSIIALVHCHECRHFNKGCQLPRQYCPAVDRGSVLCRVIATCGRGSYLFNSRGQSNSQPVCKVWTGPPPSPPDLKGLLLISRRPFFIATEPDLPSRAWCGYRIHRRTCWSRANGRPAHLGRYLCSYTAHNLASDIPPHRADLQTPD